MAPGQVFTVSIELSPSGEGLLVEDLKFTFDFYYILTKEKFSVQTELYTLVNRQWNDFYKITFLDFDRTVQYGKFRGLAFKKAMVRPPKSSSCARSESVGCPILVALHG